MANFSDLLTLVAPFAQGVPVFTAERALREAARQYFREVPLYQVEDQIGLMPGVAVYDIDEPDYDCEVIGVDSIKRDAYTPLNEMAGMPSTKRSGKPNGYFVANREIRFYPEPEKAEVLTVNYICRPSRDAQGIPDQLLDECQEALRVGALSLLKAQPDTDWSNQAEVAYYSQLFQQEINERKVQILSSPQHSSPSAMIGRFI